MKDQPQALLARKKAYEAPLIKCEAQMPLVTAGSFDLLIPNG